MTYFSTKQFLLNLLEEKQSHTAQDIQEEEAFIEEKRLPKLENYHLMTSAQKQCWLEMELWKRLREYISTPVPTAIDRMILTYASPRQTVSRQHKTLH